MPLNISKKNGLQTKEPETEDNTHNVTDQIKDDLKQLRDDLGKDVSVMPESEIDDPVNGIFLPELKGLEILKEGTYAIDPEKTISNMVAVVKKMEAQLQNALLINSDLEKDLDDAKEMIIDLRAEKADLWNTVARLEEEIPSKRELQMEIEYLIEERSYAQRKIRDLKLKIEEIEKKTAEYKDVISDLKEDKIDSRIGADYLVIKLDSSLEKNKIQMDEIKHLDREKLAKIEKLKILEQEFKKADEQRYRIYREKIK